MKKLILLYIINVFLPISIGGFIYIGFRDENLLLFRWFKILGISNITDYVRFLIINNINFLPTQAIYSLPGALWLYSFMSFNILLWRDSNSKIKYIWIIIPSLLAINSELLQKVHFISGTYSSIDIFYYLIAILISLLLIKRKTYEQKYSY